MTTDDKVREGVEHLQSAALELIAAARVFLDIAEDAVKEPGDFAAWAGATAASAARAGGAGGGGSGRSHNGDPGVEHIRVV